MNLQETLDAIRPADEGARAASWKHWDAIAKPLRSLGRLETVITQIAAVQGSPRVDIGKKALITMCADNGVVAEGVTQTGQEVTAQVAENFLSEKATAAILCRKAGADIFPIDIGIYRDTCIRNCKVSYGTRNMAKEPAMSREDAVRALEIGIMLAEEKHSEGEAKASRARGPDGPRSHAAQAVHLAHEARRHMQVHPDLLGIRKAGH